jgi:DNA-binding NarL/FixJ family response regulator
VTLRILIADDSRSLRQALKNMLSVSPEKWEICGEAADGHEAVSQTVELKPDVVLLDLSIPALSGIEVVKSLRQQQSPATVVLMSQQDPEIMKRLASSAGVPFYVAKAQLVTELPLVLQRISEDQSK